MNESLSLIKCYLSKLIQVYKISSLDMKNSYCTPMWSSLQFSQRHLPTPKSRHIFSISANILRRDQDGCLNHGGLFYDAFISTLLQLNLPPPRARPPSPEIWPRPPNHPSSPPSSLREFFLAAWHSKGLTDSHLLMPHLRTSKSRDGPCWPRRSRTRRRSRRQHWIRSMTQGLSRSVWFR